MRSITRRKTRQLLAFVENFTFLYIGRLEKLYKLLKKVSQQINPNNQLLRQNEIWKLEKCAAI